MSLFLVFILALFQASAFPITVAIVDTGVYGDHPEIDQLKFINKVEKRDGRDNDRNGYIDDRYGWNFISMSPLVFDSTLYPHFEEDFFTYYKIRKKRSLNISTEAEDDWYKKKLKDDAFQEKRDQFRRFSHATHVAGLASGLGLKAIVGERNFDLLGFRPKIMGITYLGDAISGPAVEPEYTPASSSSPSQKIKSLNSFLTRYLKWQKKKFELAMDYGASKAEVINCSFGISPKGAKSMVEGWWKQEFKEDSFLGEKERLTRRLREGLLELTLEVVSKHPNTLFVFSAGNTKLDTEKETHYPSGVQCDHCLSVGATLGTEEMASFTNFAKSRVSLFAPGVGMTSIVPFNRTLPVNGTSQAAPQVAYTAALIFHTAKNQGMKVTGSIVKKIIENSVDRKSWLKDKSASEGILNPLRARFFTQKLGSMSFSRAKKLSYKKVKDLTYYPGPRPTEKLDKFDQEADELF